MQSPSAQFSSLLGNITKLGDYDSFMEVLSRKCLASPENADAYGEELFRFLYLKALYIKVSPSPTVDQCWHCLLLFPLMYKQVCKILLSAQNALDFEEGIISHDPLGGDNQFAQNKRYETALMQYRIHFPSGPLVAGIWPERSAEHKTRGMKRTHDDVDNADGMGDERLGIAQTAHKSYPAVASTENEVNETSINSDHSPDEHSGQDALVTLKLIGQFGEEMLVKVNRSSAMNRIMKAYAELKGVGLDTLRFFVCGQGVNLGATVESLELDDFDEVNVLPKFTGC
jgi:hypothetical protein